jgi:hypothetical protein
MSHRKVWVMAAGILTAAFFLCGNTLAASPEKEKHAPVITKAYVADQARFGDVLKIYIEAEDPQGDMMRIATQASQNGFGGYATDFIFLKSQYRKQFKGYLTFNTHSVRASFLPEWTQLKLTLSVIDRAGNESREVVLPVELISSRAPVGSLPEAFADKELPKIGTITVDLMNPVAQAGNSAGVWDR